MEEAAAVRVVILYQMEMNQELLVDLVVELLLGDLHKGQVDLLHILLHKEILEVIVIVVQQIHQK